MNYPLLTLLVAAALISTSHAATTQPADILIADFEQPTYLDWTTTGDAFGAGPAHGTLPNQQSVTGFLGHGLVNSYLHGDASQGTLTSPPFVIQKKFINFLIGGGNHPHETCINLLLDNQILRTQTGQDDERLEWASWNVSDLLGKSVRIQIVDHSSAGWGHINIDQILQSDQPREIPIMTSPLFAETYRPQFHFTAEQGWLNDPNGLVFYDGEYHLFFQHNPSGNSWGNMTWGHAVSSDLLHWHQLPNAISPDSLGDIFSGSAVVDGSNSANFQSGPDKTLLAIYTAAGNPYTQCIAYSNDRGRTFTKYPHNPVLPNQAPENRDPKVIFYQPSSLWIMALYKSADIYALYSSPNLKSWTHLQDLKMPGCGECPDFFPLPLDNDPKNILWIFTAANARYFVGSFDGKSFIPNSPAPLQVEFGQNCYAVQTYSDIPSTDSRRIQIAWMNGGQYPHMPFNQQMSFPCRLTLHETPNGPRLQKYPIKEIASLYKTSHQWKNLSLTPNANPLSTLTGNLFDISLQFIPNPSSPLTLKIFGHPIIYSLSTSTLTALGSAPLSPIDNKITLRILVDRTSIETYANDGQVSLTSCYLPLPSSIPLDLSSPTPTQILSLQVHDLRSALP